MLQEIKPISELDERSEILETKISLDGINYRKGTKFSVSVRNVYGKNLLIRINIYPRGIDRGRSKFVEFSNPFPLKFFCSFSNSISLNMFTKRRYGKRNFAEMAKLILENAIAKEVNLLIDSGDGKVRFTLLGLRNYSDCESRKIDYFKGIFFFKDK